MTHAQEDLEGEQYSLKSCRLGDLGAWGHLGMGGSQGTVAAGAPLQLGGTIKTK